MDISFEVKDLGNAVKDLVFDSRGKQLLKKKDIIVYKNKRYPVLNVDYKTKQVELGRSKQSNITTIAGEILKKAGDPEWEGLHALRMFINMMHTSGIYESLQRLSSADLAKISKYDKETASKLKKVQQIVKKDFGPLVEDLNLWFKENT